MTIVTCDAIEVFKERSKILDNGAVEGLLVNSLMKEISRSEFKEVEAGLSKRFAFFSSSIIFASRLTAFNC